MEITTKPRRVTGLLCSAARARLTGEGYTGYSSSSGSEHEAATCLSRLVQAFLEKGSEESDAQDCSRDESEEGDETVFGYRNCAVQIKELLDPVVEIDPFRVRLASAVSKATEAEKALRWEKPGLFHRAVMGRLRNLGYDAGICKSRWETVGGLTGGSHEYLDVVLNQTRYIVEAEFATGIEVARATEEYMRIVKAVPDVVVAQPEAIGQAVRLVAEAARRSLRESEMHVPPWRKSRYMLAKWLGPYKRSTNVLMGPMTSGAEVKCRAVGFPSASVVEGFQHVQAARMR
ncbi:DUF506 family protein (DUF506) [Rhynchospora pubera]|uniref:DUF506 family protein (DUF506) n=1 Tax=Rhynchospora pubera TaxID=906938 RepID=A0AAV8G004_9POAL|nr:DUF506 family protein (DUF506) [Rhynchospora pubera]